MISRKGPRDGTTLTEVLMSLLVMGIGLVSVATLFPISLLRSVEATKLTNATLLRLNAEARIKASVSPTSSGVIPHAIIEDPDADGDTREHDLEKFVFDPLGVAIMSGDGTAPVLVPNVTAFGDFNGDALIDSTDYNFDVNGDGEPDFQIARYAFDRTSVAAAREFATLPDSFITFSDQLGGNFTYVAGVPSVVMTGGPSLAEAAGQRVRVTALRADVRGSAVRYGTVSTALPYPVTLESPFPSTYSDATIGRVIIDLPEQRYTWFATVRRLGVRPSVTIVACFRRNFSPDDERVYLCGEPAGSYNEFTYNPADNGGVTPPGLKRGGWMFDLYTFRWWKITQVREQTSGVILLSTDATEYDPSFAARPVYAMFPRNVIEAYTLKKE